MKSDGIKKRNSCWIESSIFENVKNASALAGTGISEYISTVLNAFIKLPDDFKKQLADVCILELLHVISNTELYEDEKTRDERIENLRNFLKLLDKTYELPIDKNVAGVQLKNGTLIYPIEWKLINPAEANTKQYAYLIEIMNCQKKDKPFFIGFCDKPVYTFTDEEEKKALAKCAKEFPKYAEYMTEQQGEDNNHSVTGIFTISDYGNPEGVFPYGASILRTRREML